jgi:cell division septation protein DedD
MITIGSSHTVSEPPVETASAAATSEPVPGAPDSVAERKKRLQLMAIPITLSVGLLVAAGYVGHRIVSAKSAAPQQTVHTQVPAAPSAPAPVAPDHEEERVPSAASSSGATVTPAVHPPETLATKEAVTLPAFEPVPTSSEDTGLIDPQPGQRYLQIAAISSRAIDWFMAEQRRNNMHVRLAPGPHEGLVRVLIGPFPDWDSLYGVKAQIQKMWPDAFVRAY